MGKMDEKEMVAISIIAIIFSPFILVGRLIKKIGESLGFIEEENHDYDPMKDPNYVPPRPYPEGSTVFGHPIHVQTEKHPDMVAKDEPKTEGVAPTENSDGDKPQIGQGFENPNRLDPNS